MSRQPLPTVEILGVTVTPASMDDALDAVLADASAGRRSTAAFLAVNNLVIARRSRSFGDAIRTFDYVFTDGAPLAWLAKLKHRRHRAERVTARDFMWRCCAAAERSGISVFLYGTTAPTLAALATRLLQRYPRLMIAGTEESVFRPLRDEEVLGLVSRVNASGARLLFVALGCPLQELFVAEHKDAFHTVQLCVGSAFRTLAGELTIAPPLMQRLGFEWLYRLLQEPRRLWKRYLLTNTIFSWWLLRRTLQRAAAVVTRERP